MLSSNINKCIYADFIYEQTIPFVYEVDIHNLYEIFLDIKQELYLNGEAIDNNQQIIEDSLKKGMEMYLNELSVSREMSDF